jgi:hypothetical protein
VDKDALFPIPTETKTESRSSRWGLLGRNGEVLLPKRLDARDRR